MYGKLFAQMYDGSLVAHGPWQALVTFQQFIILADKEGVVDMTPTAIAGRTSIPLEIIEVGIKALEQPDPDSRTPDEEGRRIVRLSDSRSWGWRIVNYMHYRKIRSAEERREYQREYARKRRSKAVDKDAKRSTRVDNVDSQQVSTESTNSSKQYAVSSKQETTSAPKGATSKYPNFPTTDSQRFHRTCINLGFAVDMGVLRKTLAPLYPSTGQIYTTDQLDKALVAFIEARGGQPPDRAKWWNLSDFVKDTARWVRLGAMPRSDANGITERGRLAVGQ